MDRQYVGIDLHRRRSVIVRANEAGQILSTRRIPNDPVALALEIAEAGPDAEVVLEATYGWYWAVDLLQEHGLEVHLAHPLGLNWGNRRRKDDLTDATDLIDMLRLGRLPESWIAPPEVREIRELVRYRAKCRAIQSGLKAQVHAVLAKEGVLPPVEELWGPGGTRALDELDLASAYQTRLESLRDLIATFDREVAMLDIAIHARLKSHDGYQAVQALNGVGRVLAAVFVAEIGDVRRFPRAANLCSWAGLTPRHRESDTTVIRGHITKQGSKLVRWAAVEAVSRYHGTTSIKSAYRRISERRGRNIARIAAARRLLTLVYYGLRDGEIRCLVDAEDAA